MGSLKFYSGDGSKQSRLCGFGREITCRDDAAQTHRQGFSLGLTQKKILQVFSRGCNRPAVLGTYGKKGTKCEF